MNLKAHYINFTHAALSTFGAVALIFLPLENVISAEIDPVNDEAAKEFQLIYDLFVNRDLESLKKDSLYLDLISRPGGNHIAELVDTLERDRREGFETPDRYRGSTEYGFSSSTKERASGGISSLLIGDTRIVVKTSDGSIVVVTIITEEDEEELEFLYGGDDYEDDLDVKYEKTYGAGVHSTWIYDKRSDRTYAEWKEHLKDMAETTSDQYSDDDDDDTDDEGGKEAFGGTDEDSGTEGGPLNDQRPIILGDLSTLRLGSDHDSGSGDLEKEVKDPNEGTIRMDPQAEAILRDIREESVNAGILFFIQGLMNGGDGFDPANTADDEDGKNGLGPVEGGIGPNGGPVL